MTPRAYCDNATLIRASFDIVDRDDAYPIGQIIMREAALLPSISAATFGELLNYVPHKALTGLSAEMSGYVSQIMGKPDWSMTDEIILDKVGKISDHRRKSARMN